MKNISNANSYMNFSNKIQFRKIIKTDGEKASLFQATDNLEGQSITLNANSYQNFSNNSQFKEVMTFTKPDGKKASLFKLVDPNAQNDLGSNTELSSHTYFTFATNNTPTFGQQNDVRNTNTGFTYTQHYVDAVSNIACDEEGKSANTITILTKFDAQNIKNNLDCRSDSETLRKKTLKE